MIQRALFVLVALAVVFVTSGQAQSQAQAPADQGQQQQRPSQPQPPSSPSVPSAGAQAATSSQGELVEVVAKDNTLTIKTAAGTEMKFSYDDSTKVTGAQKGVAGLATMKGTQLTVNYKKDGDKMIATSIEVRPAALTRPAEPSTRPAEPSPRPSPEQPR